MAKSARWAKRTCRDRILLVLTIAGLACAPGVPAPHFPTPFNVVARDSIRQYLRRLEFDTRHGAGDEQQLPVDCPACRLGPQVEILPETRNHNNKSEHLAKGPGRIIARLINRDPKQGYPAYNLAPGDTVWWAVDSVTAVDQYSSRGRSLYISAKGLRGEHQPVVLTGPLTIDEHPGAGLDVGLARWIDSTSPSWTRGGKQGSLYEGEAPGGGTRPSLRLTALAAWASCKEDGCCR